MARPKRNSEVLEKAERRNESLRSINPELNFGGGLTLAAYTLSINNLRSKLAAYNTALSAIDRLADEVKMAEQDTKAISEKMLLGVASRFGKDSLEYEMAGGSRRTGKRRSGSPSPAPTTPTQKPTLASTNGATPAVVSTQ
jgi:hypothetical protein